MRTTTLVCTAALALVLGLCAEAFAQSRTAFGSSSSRSLGGSMGGGRSRSMSGYGGSGLGGGMMGSSGSNMGNFLIQRRPGQFVGSDTSDISRVFGGLTDGGYGSGMGGYGSRSSYGTTGYGSRGGYGGYGMQSRTGMRGMTQTGMRYSIGPAPSIGGPNGGASGPGASIGGAPIVANGPDPFGTMLAEKLARSNRIASRGPLTVVSQGATVVLQGEVASFHDRELAEMYVLLEPGVGAVDNRLTVAGAMPPPAASATQPQPALEPPPSQATP